MRKAGDWTGKLMEKIASPDNKTPNISKISIDGPYGLFYKFKRKFIYSFNDNKNAILKGTSAENIFKYEKVVLIGAGIGVTPYASILKDIWHHLGSTEPDEFNLKLKKVYFYWIFSAIDSFEW